MYGPVRTVVWQGSAGDRRPYADLTGKTEVILKLALMGHCPGRHPSRLRAGARGPQLFQQRARSPYYRNHDEMGQGRRVTLDWKALGVTTKN